MFVDDSFGEVEFEDVFIKEYIFVGSEGTETVDVDMFTLAKTVGASDGLLVMNGIPR